MSRVTLTRMSAAIVIALVFVVPLCTLGVGAQVEVPKFQLPAVITAPGQAPEYAIVNMMFNRIRIPVKTDPMLEADQIGDAKTLIIIIGGSGKGLGAAGVDLADEVARAKRLLQTAKQRGTRVLGIHVGGEARRGDNSQVMIDLVTPQCACVIVRSDGNADGVFTKLTQQAKIPLLVIEKTTELSDIFMNMFQ
ncbi:MAG: DUF6305 family protein [Firmicutes bacterium]|nr:DUF6305 family protein [Bacillota bacterium]